MDTNLWKRIRLLEQQFEGRVEMIMSKIKSKPNIMLPKITKDDTIQFHIEELSTNYIPILTVDFSIVD